MESAILSALVLLCGFCVYHSVSQVLVESEPSQQMSCFVSCVCNNYSQVRCAANQHFQQSVLDFDRFLINSKAKKNLLVHIQVKGTKLPYFLPKLSKVYNLSLAGNNICEVQDGMLGGMQLYELNLSHNAIQKIHPQAFQGLQYIRIVDLSHNRLTSLSKLVFLDLPSLEVLNLGFNQLIFFPFDASTNVPQLQELILNNNNLSYLLPGSLVSLQAVRTLSLRNNSFTSFELNIVDEMPSLEDLDVSRNPFHCACALRGLSGVVHRRNFTLVKSNQTTCSTPLSLRDRPIADVMADLISYNCTEPRSVIKYDALQVLYTTVVDLNCYVQGDPDPAILWITPWGDQFADPSHVSRLEVVCESCKHQRKYRGIGIDLDSEVSVLRGGKNLHITNFRSYFSGNITCVAYNFLGNDTTVHKVTVYTGIPDSFIQSLMFGGMCAAGALCLGLLVGSIKLMVLACLKRFGKKKKVALTVTPSQHQGSSNSDENNSLTEDSHCKDDSLDFIDEDEFYPPETPFTTPTASSPTASPRKVHTPDDGQETPPGGWLPTNIFETMDEVRWRLRYGVGQKMKTIKRNVQSIKETGIRNVQSIKESGSVYVHNVMESGSTAANRVKAGVVLGMETVKYHVQSIKEFCGTGDMGTQTISMISVETDLDTNESREVIKSITIV